MAGQQLGGRGSGASRFTHARVQRPRLVRNVASGARPPLACHLVLVERLAHRVGLGRVGRKQVPGIAGCRLLLELPEAGAEDLRPHLLRSELVEDVVSPGLDRLNVCQDDPPGRGVDAVHEGVVAPHDIGRGVRMLRRSSRPPLDPRARSLLDRPGFASARDPGRHQIGLVLGLLALLAHLLFCGSAVSLALDDMGELVRDLLLRRARTGKAHRVSVGGRRCVDCIQLCCGAERDREIREVLAERLLHALAMRENVRPAAFVREWGIFLHRGKRAPVARADHVPRGPRRVLGRHAADLACGSRRLRTHGNPGGQRALARRHAPGLMPARPPGVAGTGPIAPVVRHPRDPVCRPDRLAVAENRIPVAQSLRSARRA